MINFYEFNHLNLFLLCQEHGSGNSLSKPLLMSRAFTDDEASKEMKKMVTFILQEANEKAKEIRIKADEEFNIEKAKLVRQETTAIESNYTRRLNLVDVKKKM